MRPHTYRLVCADGHPVTGAGAPNADVPNAATACALVTGPARSVFFGTPSSKRTCTQQSGGQETAAVSGSIAGRTVNVRFSLTNGCEISTWQQLKPLLGTPGAQ